MSIGDQPEETAVGISEIAFYCGLRFPLLPLVKVLLRDMGIAIGQLDLNGFIHMNTFQYRCLQHEVPSLSVLFWHHYDFRKNAKSPGFYNITPRTGRSEWAATNSSNKKTHSHWCYVVGPTLTRFSEWREVDPSERVRLKALSDDEKLLYRKLNTPLVPENKLPLATTRDGTWLKNMMGTSNVFIFPSCTFFFIN